MILGKNHVQEDHNLKAAYLHVLVDALTSILAIVALLAAKYLNWIWVDPAVGILGAFLIIRWSKGLIWQSGGVLLDRQAPANILESIHNAIETLDDNRIVDLHVWTIAPSVYAAEIVLLTKKPQSPDYYKRLIPEELGIQHFVCEVHCRHESEEK